MSSNRFLFSMAKEHPWKMTPTNKDTKIWKMILQNWNKFNNAQELMLVMTTMRKVSRTRKTTMTLTVTTTTTTTTLNWKISFINRRRPFQGCDATVTRLSNASSTGRCCFVRHQLLLTNLKQRFVAERELTNEDLALFACMLRNDYIGQIKGKGIVRSKEKTKDYVTRTTRDEQEEWIHNNHVMNLDSEYQKIFHCDYEKILHTIPKAMERRYVRCYYCFKEGKWTIQVPASTPKLLRLSCWWVLLCPLACSKLRQHGSDQVNIRID